MGTLGDKTKSCVPLAQNFYKLCCLRKDRYVWDVFIKQATKPLYVPSVSPLSQMKSRYYIHITWYRLLYLNLYF